MWPNQSLKSEGNAPIETEPMIKQTNHSSIGCNGMPGKYYDDYHGLEMYKNQVTKDSTTEGCMQPDPTNMECMWPNQSLKGQGNAEGQWMTSQAQITLIEVKYTRNTDPSRTYQDP